jgi:hypothetical protein
MKATTASCYIFEANRNHAYSTVWKPPLRYAAFLKPIENTYIASLLKPKENTYTVALLKPIENTYIASFRSHYCIMLHICSQ